MAVLFFLWSWVLAFWAQAMSNPFMSAAAASVFEPFAAFFPCIGLNVILLWVVSRQMYNWRRHRPRPRRQKPQSHTSHIMHACARAFAFVLRTVSTAWLLLVCTGICTQFVASALELPTPEVALHSELNVSALHNSVAPASRQLPDMGLQSRIAALMSHLLPEHPVDHLSHAFIHEQHFALNTTSYPLRCTSHSFAFLVASHLRSRPTGLAVAHIIVSPAYSFHAPAATNMSNSSCSTALHLAVASQGPQSAFCAPLSYASAHVPLTTEALLPPSPHMYRLSPRGGRLSMLQRFGAAAEGAEQLALRFALRLSSWGGGARNTLAAAGDSAGRLGAAAQLLWRQVRAHCMVSPRMCMHSLGAATSELGGGVFVTFRACMTFLSPVFFSTCAVVVSNLSTVAVLVTFTLITVIINWLLCWALCPGAALANALDSIRSAPDSHRMTLRLWLYRSVTGRWRRGTRRVNALRRPLAFREDLQGWSRRVILALAALLALAIIMLALLTPALLGALRGASLEPALQPAYCDKIPFALDEELFSCAPAGTPLPPWSRPDDPVEFATHLDNTLTYLWSGARSLVERFATELGDFLTRPAWSTLEALAQPGDPAEAWMSPPRFVPSQISPTSLTSSLTTRLGNNPFFYTLVSAVNTALTSGPHWRSACAGLAVDSRATQAVCTGFSTWQSAVVRLQSAGPAAQLLPVFCTFCIAAFMLCIFDELADGRAEVHARAAPEPTQTRPRGQTRAPNPQPGRHTPGRMNRRKRRSRRPAETDDTPGSSPGETTSGTTEEVVQTPDANAVAPQVSPNGHVLQPSMEQGNANTAPCANGECVTDDTQADEGTGAGVATSASAHCGVVPTTCAQVVARTSGIAARLPCFAVFLSLNVLRFFCLTCLRILLLPFSVIHLAFCIIWHFAVTIPLHCIRTFLWTCSLPLRGVNWIVLGALAQLAAGVMNLSRRAARVPFRPASDPPGHVATVPTEVALQQQDSVASEHVRACTCAFCCFHAYACPVRCHDTHCCDCTFTNNSEITSKTQPGIQHKAKSSCTNPGSSQPATNCCPNQTSCTHAHTVVAASLKIPCLCNNKFAHKSE
jgi:hypothetical protein